MIFTRFHLPSLKLFSPFMQHQALGGSADMYAFGPSREKSLENQGPFSQDAVGELVLLVRAGSQCGPSFRQGTPWSCVTGHGVVRMRLHWVREWDSFREAVVSLRSFCCTAWNNVHCYGGGVVVIVASPAFWGLPMSVGAASAFSGPLLLLSRPACMAHVAVIIVVVVVVVLVMDQTQHPTPIQQPPICESIAATDEVITWCSSISALTESPGCFLSISKSSTHIRSFVCDSAMKSPIFAEWCWLLWDFRCFGWFKMVHG